MPNPELADLITLTEYIRRRSILRWFYRDPAYTTFECVHCKAPIRAYMHRDFGHARNCDREKYLTNGK